MDYITSNCHKCKGSGDRLIRRYNHSSLADIGICLTCMGSRTLKYKKLNETEMLSVKRLMYKKVPFSDIANRLSVSIETILANLETPSVSE